MISSPRTAWEKRYACSPKRFEKHILYLKRHGFNLVSLQEVENHLVNGLPLPPRAVAITLDDGYADNYSNAYRVLRKHQAPATVFLTTNWIQNGAVRSKSESDSKNFNPASNYPMLTWDQVKEMARRGSLLWSSHGYTSSNDRSGSGIVN